MSRTRKLLVVRPGTIDADLEAYFHTNGDFHILRLDSLDCPRRTAIGVRYHLDPSENCDLVVLPVSELSCVRVIEGSSPVVIAYGEVQRMESAYLLGAVEYLVEPWSVEELRVRARRVLGGYAGTNGIAQHRGSAVLGTRFLSLSPKERSAFDLLSRHAGRIVDRETLAHSIGISPRELRSGSRAVDMLVSRLRRTLGRYGAAVETIRGIGYRLRVDNRWINDAENGSSNDST